MLDGKVGILHGLWIPRLHQREVSVLRKKRANFDVEGRRRSTKKPSTVFVPFGSEVSELKLGVENDNRPFATVDVLGVKLIGLLDSGAQISILGTGSENLVKRLKLKLLPTTTKLSTAGGFQLKVLGYVNLPITFNGQTKIVTTLVAPLMTRRLILGMNFWRMFKIEPTIQGQLGGVADVMEADVEVEKILTAEQQARLEEVKNRFKVFRDGDRLGVTPLISHTID